MLKIVSFSSIVSPRLSSRPRSILHSRHELRDGTFINLIESRRHLPNPKELDAAIQSVENFTGEFYRLENKQLLPPGWRLIRISRHSIKIESLTYQQPRIFILICGDEIVIIGLEKFSNHTRESHEAFLRPILESIQDKNLLQRDPISPLITQPPEHPIEISSQSRSSSVEESSHNRLSLEDISLTSLYTEEGNALFIKRFSKWKTALLKHTAIRELYGGPDTGYYIGFSDPSKPPVLITAKEGVWNKLRGDLWQTYINGEDDQSPHNKKLAKVLIDSGDLMWPFWESIQADTGNLVKAVAQHSSESEVPQGKPPAKKKGNENKESIPMVAREWKEEINTLLTSTPTPISTLLDLLKTLTTPDLKSQQLDDLLTTSIQSGNLPAVQAIYGISKAKKIDKKWIIIKTSLFFQKFEIVRQFSEKRDVKEITRWVMEYHNSKPTDLKTWLSSRLPLDSREGIADIFYALIQTNRFECLAALFETVKNHLSFSEWTVLFINTTPENNPLFFSDQNLQQYAEKTSGCSKDEFIISPLWMASLRRSILGMDVFIPLAKGLPTPRFFDTLDLAHWGKATVDRDSSGNLYTLDIRMEVLRLVTDVKMYNPALGVDLARHPNMLILLDHFITLLPLQGPQNYEDIRILVWFLECFSEYKEVAKILESSKKMESLINALNTFLESLSSNKSYTFLQVHPPDGILIPFSRYCQEIIGGSLARFSCHMDDILPLTTHKLIGEWTLKGLEAGIQLDFDFFPEEKIKAASLIDLLSSTFQKNSL
jgi:hypothetical protein